MNTKEKVFCKDKKDFCNKYGCIGCEFAKGNGIIPAHYANDVLSTVFGLDYNLDKIRETIKADREGRCVVLDSQERAVSFKRAFEITLKTRDYSIERIGELVEADRNGRCVVCKFKPGDKIWIVERYEDGEPDSVCEYMFFSSFVGFALVHPIVADAWGIDEVMDDCLRITRQLYRTDFVVFPLDDCYGSREEAEQALKK